MMVVALLLSSDRILHPALNNVCFILILQVEPSGQVTSIQVPSEQNTLESFVTTKSCRDSFAGHIFYVFLMSGEFVEAYPFFFSIK